MKRETIKVNGADIFFCNKLEITKSFISARRRANLNHGRGNEMDICPLCNNTIQEGEEVYTIVNHNKLFPNIFVHTHCIEIPDDELISKCIELTNDYKAYLKKKRIWG